MWNQGRHDLQNTATTDAVNRGTGRQLWRIPDLFCSSFSAPVVDINEIIYLYGADYIECNYNSLFAANPDGTIKWQFKSIDSTGNTYWGFNGYYEIVPTIGPDGTIYYTDGYNNDSDTNFVYAINPDGTLKWMYPVSDVISGQYQYHSMGGTVKIYSNTAYVIDYDHIYAIDAQTGILKWYYAEPNENDFYDGFVIYNGFIYIVSSSGNGTLYKINADSGIKIWSTAFTDGLYSGLSINDNGIFIMGSSADRTETSGSYAFAKFDINDGHNIWTQYIPVPDFGTGYTIYVGINSFVALDSTSVYYSVNSCYDCTGPGGPGYNFIDGRIFKYDFDGNLLWASTQWPPDPGYTGLSSISPVIDGDGYIYTGDAKKIVKLDPSNGSVIWTYPLTDRWTPSSLAIGNTGTIYFISNDTGYVDAIASETVELPVFGDGSDGDVVISQDSNLTKNTNFKNLTINEGTKLNTAGYRIRVQEKLTINGIIHNNGGGGSGGWGPNQDPPCDCINCRGSDGTGGLGYGGSGGTGNYVTGGGAGSGGNLTLLTPPSLSDLVNFGFPYLGGGGGGGGSSNQSTNCGGIPNDMWMFGGGGYGGSGGGIVIIQANEIIYGPNGSVQANGIDGGYGTERIAHTKDWWFDCCPNFIPISGGCKTGGFDCSQYIGYGCPDLGGFVCDERGGGGGGGGGGAHFIVSNKGFDPTRHQVNHGNGGGLNGFHLSLQDGFSGDPGQSGNIYYYQVGPISLNVTVSAVSNQMNSNETSQITVRVTDINGPIEGADVSILTTNGSLDPTSGITDINGDFISTFTSPTIISTEVDTITATASKSGYIDGSGSTQITINPILVTLTSVDIIPTNPTIAVGQDLTLTAIPKDQGGNPIANGITITWIISDDTKATVDPLGITTTLHGVSATIIPITITVSATDGINTVTNSTDATVTYSPVLTTIEVSPSSTSILIGGIQQFIAICKDQYTSTIDCPTITWNVSDDTIGSIDPSTGLFTGISQGQTTVIATNGSIFGNASVTVTTVQVAQAGFGNIGMFLTAGLLFGLLLHKKCKDYKTKDDCDKKEQCKWERTKCIDKDKKVQ